MKAGRGRRRWVRLVSEFAVIVVGVLLALAVDQWVRSRADRVVETEYLVALASDLRADTQLFSEVTRLLSLSDSTLAEIGPIARGAEPFPTDTIALLRRVVSSRRTLAGGGRSPAYDELISTGSLRLIQSSPLRAALVSYYSDLRAIRLRGQERESGYASVVRGLLPDDPVSGSNVSEADIREYGLPQAMEALTSPGFVQALNRHVAYIEFLRPQYMRLQAELESLQELVDAQLAG